MTKKRSISYLRSYRLRWGLSQDELSYLIGGTKSDISRLEKKRTAPSAKVVIACYVIFGTRAAELFPGMFQDVETEVMKRVWDLYERIQGNSSRPTKAKIELLEDAIERAERRRQFEA
jgi:transcriptional regulator with XRE-family HTH domain